jgi:hypothetical protein
MAWCQYYDGGRAWLTTLGHDANAFIDGSAQPGQAEFKRLIVARHQVGDGPDAFLPDSSPARLTRAPAGRETRGRYSIWRAGKRSNGWRSIRPRRLETRQ